MSRVKRRALILASLSLISLVLITYQHRTAPITSFRGLSYPFDVLNSVTDLTVGALKDVFSSFNENRQLRKELADALLERQRVSEILQENKRLRELLLLKEHMPAYLTTARVIGRGYDRFLNTLLLDKGENSGVREGMAVITPKGLVGKVYLVGGDFSRALLMRDPNFGAAVRLQASRVEGVLSGNGGSLSLVKYVPFEATVEKGEAIVTSGLDGVFPPGLPVGVVHTVNKEGVTFFQQIEVLPYQADSTIEEVIIVKSSTSPPQRPPLKAPRTGTQAP
jgi:rod shape-determining protein MreC